MDGWSVQDLVHAIVILAHFHSLCGFVFGCAVNPEPDSDYGVTWGLRCDGVLVTFRNVFIFTETGLKSDEAAPAATAMPEETGRELRHQASTNLLDILSNAVSEEV